ncbi:DNA-binding transcriptional regulator YbjK [Leucobacter exalbidus]|uniref:DNA-binding transcriptional regulator YbjK n=1 Tax=Leucobacter exalbidus TaxID=662960 RepID=A0A940PQW2_9MICO|nr:TetR family transcriptional regulator [Leucobacter exalbidus]MBP1325924.1 DNA-binding transcriptional regulator YbjK [Leucobacter exalbidus]
MTAEPHAARRRDPEARRREILAAATQLIVENGAASLTHRAVAARANVPLGSTTQHFSSIDDIRDAALQVLADETDVALARMATLIDDVVAHPEPFVDVLIEFLADERTLKADIALMTTATVDPHLRALALRWNDRLIEMLARQIGHERATAIVTYYDGVTIHAGLNEAPLDHGTLLRTIKALMAMPDPDPSSPTPRTAAA